MSRRLAKKPVFYSLFALALNAIVIGSFSFAANDNKKESAPKPEDAVSLTVSAVLNAPGPTLAFTITNNTKLLVPSIEAGQDPSRIIVVKPTGEEVTDFFIAGPPRPGTQRPMLTPTQSRTSNRNVFELFGKMQLKEPGIYRVYWKFLQKQGNAVVEHRSNEIPILREAGTPVFNPFTGRPEPE
jgi:hypothetical protein